MKKSLLLISCFFLSHAKAINCVDDETTGPDKWHCTRSHVVASCESDALPPIPTNPESCFVSRSIYVTQEYGWGSIGPGSICGRQVQNNEFGSRKTITNSYETIMGSWRHDSSTNKARCHYGEGDIRSSIVNINTFILAVCPAAKRHEFESNATDSMYICANPVCGKGYKWVKQADNGQGACWPVKDVIKDLPPQVCQGNPIYPISGTKREIVSLGISLANQNFKIIYDSGKSPWGYDEINGPFAQPGSLRVQSGEIPAWGQLGKLWWSTFDRRLLISPNGQSIKANWVQSTIGESFNISNGAWVSFNESNQLTSIANGYHHIDRDGLIQGVYGVDGLLQNFVTAFGKKITPTYSTNSTPPTAAPASGHLLRLSDAFGRSIEFEYDTLANGDVGVKAIKDAAGQSIAADYSSAGNLVSLTWADGAVRTFVYDSPNENQFWALTGIIDENKKRYATFSYSPSGFAESTQHAGGVDKYRVSYVAPPKPVIREEVDMDAQVVWRHHEWQIPTGAAVLQPDGGSSIGFNATAVMGISSSQGTIRSSGASQPAGAGCAASSSALTYDNRGNISSQDDFNGKRVCYNYESGRNFENVRIEGLNGGGSGNSCTAALNASNVATLTGEARKITTEWHPDWKLETRRAEPGRITTWIYNGQPDPFNGGAIASCTSPMYGATSVDPLPDGKPIAVLCKQVIQSTTDVNGSQGFSATLQTQDPGVVWPQVTSRTTSYTYNQFGQVLTSTDERGQVTTNTYYTATTANYTKGDLWKVTNALGHVTEYTQYNPHGQVLQVLDPNGVVTSYTYDLRQRLTSVTQAGQLTQLDWWPTGLLKKVTQPDGSFQAYTYDDAHRLTDIADNLGNAVHYELDNAGNRKKEQVKDSSGVLTRQIDRNYDALNRLWKTSTGAPM